MPGIKAALLFFVECSFWGIIVLMIKKNIYAAPNIFIGSCIFGIMLYRILENIKHSIITIKIPVNMPALNGMLFLKPAFFAAFIDIMLLGPGVYAIITIYDKNEIHGNIVHPYGIDTYNVPLFTADTFPSGYGAFFVVKRNPDFYQRLAAPLPWQ